MEGYEIHMGRTVGPCRPLFVVQGEDGGRDEGAVSDDGRVAGTYLHGLFDDFSVLAGLARLLGVPEARIEALRPVYLAHREAKDEAYERLAAVFREHLDLDHLRALVWGDGLRASPLGRGAPPSAPDPAGARHEERP